MALAALGVAALLLAPFAGRAAFSGPACPAWRMAERLLRAPLRKAWARLRQAEALASRMLLVLLIDADPNACARADPRPDAPSHRQRAAAKNGRDARATRRANPARPALLRVSCTPTPPPSAGFGRMHRRNTPSALFDRAQSLRARMQALDALLTNREARAALLHRLQRRARAAGPGKPLCAPPLRRGLWHAVPPPARAAAEMIDAEHAQLQIGLPP